MTQIKCPKCGSGNTDMPRQYEAYLSGMRLQHCRRICLDCHHEGTRHPSVEAAYNDLEWKRPTP